MKNVIFKYTVTVLLLLFLLSSGAFAMERVKTVIDEKTVRLEYLDENNNIVINPTLGYAIILRTLDENGHFLTDLLFLRENGLLCLSFMSCLFFI